MSLLEVAEPLGNVTKAFKMKGVSRSQFYEYKRRFQIRGLEGLRDLPPIHTAFAKIFVGYLGLGCVDKSGASAVY